MSVCVCDRPAVLDVLSLDGSLGSRLRLLADASGAGSCAGTGGVEWALTVSAMVNASLVAQRAGWVWAQGRAVRRAPLRVKPAVVVVAAESANRARSVRDSALQ